MRWVQVLVVLGLLALGSVAFGESLWRDDAWFSEPYVVRKASSVGDMVVVVLEENARGTASASSQGS
ncbi:MAG: hypothetical protein ABDK93_04575, partial [Atribacterota bacterium]